MKSKRLRRKKTWFGSTENEIGGGIRRNSLQLSHRSLQTELSFPVVTSQRIAAYIWHIKQLGFKHRVNDAVLKEPPRDSDFLSPVLPR